MVTYNLDSGQLVSYVNGRPDASAAGVPAVSWSTNPSYRFTLGSLFNGAIDYAALHNYALSAAEVAEEFSNSLTFYDATSNRYDFTSYGNPVANSGYVEFDGTEALRNYAGDSFSQRALSAEIWVKPTSTPQSGATLFDISGQFQVQLSSSYKISVKVNNVSYLTGSTQVHQAPVGVTMSIDGGASWSGLANNTPQVVAELMPLPGRSGAVYALTATSRTPLALGSAPVYADDAAIVEAPATAPAASGTSILAWIVAGLAAASLVFALVYDAARRSKRPAQAPQRTLRPQPVTNNR
jgi:hypothetical protein